MDGRSGFFYESILLVLFGRDIYLSGDFMEVDMDNSIGHGDDGVLFHLLVRFEDME